MKNYGKVVGYKEAEVRKAIGYMREKGQSEKQTAPFIHFPA
jgi:hypothetical protein